MNNKKENYQKEEWGGWKIVSDMLDSPDECGLYQTSKCYQKLYNFVCEQKRKAIIQYNKKTKSKEKTKSKVHTKYYKVKSKLSSHRGDIGKYVGSFMAQGEEYHTLRFNGREFRSYPVRNLKPYTKPKFYSIFDTKEIIAMMREAEKMFSPKKEKNKVKRFVDFASLIDLECQEPCFATKDGKVYNMSVWRMNNILEMLDYLASEIEGLKKEKR